MFSAEIFEFGSLIHALPQRYGKRLVIADNDILWEIKGLSDHRQIMEFEHPLDCFRLTEKGIWLSYKPESLKNKNQQAVFVDIFNKDVNYPEQDVAISMCEAIKDDIYFSPQYKGADERFESGIYKRNFNNEIVKSLLGSFELQVNLYKNRLIVRRRPGTILCLDFDLQEIWSFQTERDISVGNYDPQFINDMVICYLGESVEGKRDFQIVALSLADGSVKWCRIFEDYPQCWIDIIRGKLYTTIMGRILILDAHSGEILLEIPSETLFQKGKKLSKIGVSPVKNYLLAIRSEDQLLQIFTQDGKECLQTIKLPEKYFPSCSTPIEFDGRYYITMGQIGTLFFAYNAILILTPDENAPAEVAVALPKRPPFEVSRIKNEKGEHEHIVSVSCENLDELIKYATITLKEIALTTSSKFERRKRNTKHNGRLHLRVDPKPLPEGGFEQLAKVKERVERFLGRRKFTAGKKKGKPFQVFIEKLEEA
jgi:hypothetical protein